MQEPILRTLHPAPAAEDLITLEHRLLQLSNRVRTLEQDRADLQTLCADLAKRVQQLEQNPPAPAEPVVTASAPKKPVTAPEPEFEPDEALLSALTPDPEPEEDAASPASLGTDDALLSALTPDPEPQSAHCPILARFDENSGVFGNHKLSRSQVSSITVLSTLSNAPSDAWDISLKNDRSALAWTKGQGDSLALFLAGKGGVNANANAAYLFSNYSSLTKLDLGRRFHTSGVTDMHWMFAGCRSLTALDLSGFDTSSVTDMERMFAYCGDLTSLRLTGFNTTKVTNMDGMFAYCGSLTTLDVSSFNTRSVTDMSRMFAGCENLTAVDLTSFDTSGDPYRNGMFVHCQKLTQETRERLQAQGFPV
ncbi:MAG: BspA family leucine-rich repeat surface protein [Candidatus Onthomonas sp.]